MKITILGSGTSTGIPMIACGCAVCTSADSRDKRLRTSILIETQDTVVSIDAGPDFRQQMLRENVKRLDAIILTHGHKDHTAGLDDIRAFNFFQQKPMDIYLTAETELALRSEYHYVFEEIKYPGIPDMRLKHYQNEMFTVQGIDVLPIEVMHLNMFVYGMRIGDFTYITDANFISPAEKEKIKGSSVLIINALRREKHISHFNLKEALEIIQEVAPQKAYLTHLSHQMGLHADVEKELPSNVFLAYDGLQITL